jgi:peroxiredoxin
MDALNIAHPATLVIDRERTVRYIYRGDNQHDRAPLTDVLAAAKKIAGSVETSKGS